MRHEVIWDPACFSQIESILESGLSARQMQQIVRIIAERLALSPETEGEPLSEGLRKLDAPPTRFYFHIDESSGAVIVDTIGLVGPTQQ